MYFKGIRKAVWTLIVVFFALQQVLPAHAQDPVIDTDGETYLPLLIQTGIRYELGWDQEKLKHEQLVVSDKAPEALQQEVLAACMVQDTTSVSASQIEERTAACQNVLNTMQLVATAGFFGSQTLYIYFVVGGPVALLALGVGFLVIYGINNLERDWSLMDQQMFTYVREITVPDVPADVAFNEWEREVQRIQVDWHAPDIELVALKSQYLSLVDASLEKFLAPNSVKAHVKVNGALKFVVCYIWADGGWASENLSPVTTVYGYEAMNIAIYSTTFSSEPTWAPPWLDPTSMKTVDGDIPAFIRPGYEPNETDVYNLVDQGVLYGTYDQNGNHLVVNPVMSVVVNGAPMLVYLSADLPAVPEEPLTGWAAMEAKVKEIRERKRQEIEPPQKLVNEYPDPEDLPNLPRKYEECPPWKIQLGRSTSKDIKRHGHEADSAYHFLRNGLLPKYGGTWDESKGHKDAFLGYYITKEENGKQFMNTGLTRWTKETVDGVERRIWALQVWRFNNIRKDKETLYDKFEWYQVTMYWRTASDSPYPPNMERLYNNIPPNPPQYTGTCGYFYD